MSPENRIDPLNKSLRFAYADPPYLWCSKLYDHPDAARWDNPDEHADLMHQMDAAYDGWALSASTPSLVDLLPFSPPGTRVGVAGGRLVEA